ncbi:hypothetical protein KUTeg_002320 [Tegillarca granosa]|uniref:Uncharacterized protein n=1 Tax=Tegillarca granosa TaxID=220873 RepID=A0ABQ9FTZ8_TEGGR|nr:hypothetical protein KUTeg_002320 [Tegillarca granosa]
MKEFEASVYNINLSISTLLKTGICIPYIIVQHGPRPEYGETRLDSKEGHYNGIASYDIYSRRLEEKKNMILRFEQSCINSLTT